MEGILLTKNVSFSDNFYWEKVMLIWKGSSDGFFIIGIIHAYIK